MSAQKHDYASTFVSNWERFTHEVRKVMVGCEEPLRLCGLAMFSDGHVILESVPGLGKTTLAFTLGYAIKNGVAGWFQGTADLLPMDIVGSMIWNPKTQEMEVKHGYVKPEFNILLADETNRVAPKTGAALLNVMQERRVNIGGQEFLMADPFLVIGTQNPIEQEGTYPMPEALLDRFAVMGELTYPDFEEEIVLAKRKAVYARNQQEAAGVEPVLSVAELRQMRHYAQEEIEISDSVYRYIVRLVRATRPKCREEFDAYMPAELKRFIAVGASGRGILWLTACSKVAAAIAGRTAVHIQDVQSAALPCLGHRIFLKTDAVFSSQSESLRHDIMAGLLEAVPTVDDQ